jgi:hypothetical protein
VADPIAELVGAMLLCSGKTLFETISALMVERRGADWKNYATHAHFTFNPDKNIAGFRLGGLKRLEMLLHYALPHVSGHSIAVWSLEDCARTSWNWAVKCHLNMGDAFGRADIVFYDDGDTGNDSKCHAARSFQQ